MADTHPVPQAQRHISDLYEDLRDGHNLISLLEVLSGDSLVRAPTRALCGPACLTWTPLSAFLPPGLSHKLVPPGPLVQGQAQTPAAFLPETLIQ